MAAAGRMCVRGSCVRLLLHRWLELWMKLWMILYITAPAATMHVFCNRLNSVHNSAAALSAVEHGPT